MEVSKENWKFYTGDNPVSSVGKLFWFGPLRWLQHLMFHTPLVLLFIFGSAVYHDKIWYNITGRKIVKDWLHNSPWGRLFDSYQPGYSKKI